MSVVRYGALVLVFLLAVAGTLSGQMSGMHGTGGMGMQGAPAARTPVGGFERGVDGLPVAQAPRTLVLPDRGVLELTAAPVRKEVAGRPVRMYAYNGSIPGPLLRVRQGSSLTVRFVNRLDLESTVHWHGIRLENSSDGVPGITQEPVRTGETHEYRLRFPDAGLFWYHPHVREDLAQELGLYGGILVEPSTAWPAVDREVVLFLDDIRLQGSDVEPFSRDEVTHALTGRFGNAYLVNGEPEWRLEAKQGERVRLYLANAANTRTFAIALEGHALKVIGSDAGRAAREGFESSVVLSPSERAVVEVMLQSPGSFRLEHKSPLRSVTLGSLLVRPAAVDPGAAAAFFRPEGDAEVSREAAALLARAPSQPDYVLELGMEMGMGGGMGMMGGTTGGMMGGHPDPIEWEEDGMMAMMNQAATNRTVRWTIRELRSGRQGMDIPLQAAVGEVKLLRIVSRADSEHPMQHPIHLHGQRFLVAARDGRAEANPVWKDTVLVPTGRTVDILVEFTGPGRWLLHCHIPEHMEAGMMTLITVKPAL